MAWQLENRISMEFTKFNQLKITAELFGYKPLVETFTKEQSGDAKEFANYYDNMGFDIKIEGEE